VHHDVADGLLTQEAQQALQLRRVGALGALATVDELIDDGGSQGLRNQIVLTRTLD
jgi:hypothetical protein